MATSTEKPTPFQAFREAKGYSRHKLAVLLARDGKRLSDNTVKGWDHGAIPDGKRLVDLAGLLGTTPDYVLRLIEQSAPKKSRKPEAPAAVAS